MALRGPALPTPLVMSDVLAANDVEGMAEPIRCHCSLYAIGKLIEIVDYFPDQAQRVIDDLTRVFEKDAATKELDDLSRLKYHQTHSKPVMQRLLTWMEDQRKRKEVAPKSSLGKATEY